MGREVGRPLGPSSWAPITQGQIPRDSKVRYTTQAQTLALTPVDDPFCFPDCPTSSLSLWALHQYC